MLHYIHWLVSDFVVCCWAGSFVMWSFFRWKQLPAVPENNWWQRLNQNRTLQAGKFLQWDERQPLIILRGFTTTSSFHIQVVIRSIVNVTMLIIWFNSINYIKGDTVKSRYCDFFLKLCLFCFVFFSFWSSPYLCYYHSEWNKVNVLTIYRLLVAIYVNIIACYLAK